LEGVAGEAVGGVFGLEERLGMLVKGLGLPRRMNAGFLLLEEGRREG